MENKGKLFLFLLVFFFSQLDSRAQSVYNFLNTGGLYTSNIPLTSIKKGDTVKIQRINKRNARPNDLTFEKGTIWIWKNNPTERKRLGTWHATNNNIVFDIHKFLFLKPLKNKSDSLVMLVYNSAAN